MFKEIHETGSYVTFAKHRDSVLAKLEYRLDIIMASRNELGDSYDVPNSSMPI